MTYQNVKQKVVPVWKLAKNKIKFRLKTSKQNLSLFLVSDLLNICAIVEGKMKT